MELVKECIDCGFCYEACPGSGFNYLEFNKRIFNSNLDRIDLNFGYYKKIYTGFSTDSYIRKMASSGGIVTSILTSLLEERVIDGAIVVGSKDKIAMNSKVLIAKDKQDIINACQSKYIITSNNKILKKLKQSQGKYAFVGLPCQIQGLRKAEVGRTWLKERIFLYIGLFCGFNLYPSATNFLLKKLGAKRDNIVQLDYRKGSMPGGFWVKDKWGKEYFIGKHGYTFLNMMFTPERCRKCFDFTSEFSDISVGDAWEKNNNGWSRIIVRSEIGEDIINYLTFKDYIHVEDSSKEDIIQSQRHLINYKKSWFWVRYKMSRYKPCYNIFPIPKISTKDKIVGTLMYICQIFFSSKFFIKITSIIPLEVLRVGSELFRKFIKNKNKLERKL